MQYNTVLFSIKLVTDRVASILSIGMLFEGESFSTQVYNKNIIKFIKYMRFFPMNRWVDFNAVNQNSRA